MKIDYIKNRFTYYTIALALFIGSFVVPFVLPVNFGIDMTGGTQAEFDYSNTFDKTKVEMAVETAKKSVDTQGRTINSVSVYGISGEKKFVVEAGFTRGNLSDAEFDAVKTRFKDTIVADFSKDATTLSRYVNVGESFGDYIKKTAYITLLIVIIAISLYIAYAFR